MCVLFGVLLVAYYAWTKRIDGPFPDTVYKELVQKAYLASQGVPIFMGKIGLQNVQSVRVPRASTSIARL